VTGGSLRLWPYAKENPNLNQPNVLAELNPAGRLDKDTYRMGEDLKSVGDKFAAIAQITGGFKICEIRLQGLKIKTRSHGETKRRPTGPPFFFVVLIILDPMLLRGNANLDASRPSSSKLKTTQIIYNTTPAF